MASNKHIQTLNDLIRYGKTSSFELPQLSFLTKEDNIVYLDSVCYDKYRDLLIGKSKYIPLTTEEYNKYRYNPKALSTEIYGTPNLYHLILWLNDTSEFEFDTTNVRLITKSTLNSIFKTILAHEEPNVLKSQANVQG